MLVCSTDLVVHVVVQREVQNNANMYKLMLCNATKNKRKAKQKSRLTKVVQTFYIQHHHCQQEWPWGGSHLRKWDYVGICQIIPLWVPN